MAFLTLLPIVKRPSAIKDKTFQYISWPMHVKGDSSAQTGQTCNVILCLVIAIVAELVDLQTR